MRVLEKLTGVKGRLSSLYRLNIVTRDDRGLSTLYLDIFASARGLRCFNVRSLTR